MSSYIRVKPLTYYKFRCSKPELEIRGLQDKIGSDFRSSEVPYNVTCLSIYHILEHQKEFILADKNGYEIVELLKTVTKRCDSERSIVDLFWNMNKFWEDSFLYELGKLTGFEHKFDANKFKNIKFWERENY